MYYYYQILECILDLCLFCASIFMPITMEFMGLRRNLHDYKEISGITKKFAQIFLFVFFPIFSFLGLIIYSFYEKEVIQVIFCKKKILKKVENTRNQSPVTVMLDCRCLTLSF